MYTAVVDDRDNFGFEVTRKKSHSPGGISKKKMAFIWVDVLRAQTWRSLSKCDI